MLQGRQLWEWERAEQEQGKHAPLLPFVQDFYAKAADDVLRSIFA